MPAAAPPPAREPPMTPSEQLRQSLESLNQALDSEDLAPDPLRTDWGRKRSDVAKVEQRLAEEVFATFASASHEWSEEDREGARHAIAVLTGEVAALLQASGNGYGATELM